MFDIFYIGENKKLQEKLPLAKEVSDEKNIKSNTKMYYVIEPNIEILDYDVFNFRPESHDMVYEHIWKWDNSNYGGLKLIPKNKNQGTKYVNNVICKKSFDILNTMTPGKYFEKNTFASHVWCVDKDYVLPDDINWAPSNFEPNFIHSFHLRGQLEHKYPAEEGGIKLYPKDWKNADIKYHGFLDTNILYPILYPEDVNDYSHRDILDDDYVWLIDREHQIETKTVDWVPNPFESGMIHAFRMPYQLTEKYPMAMGGIRLVPKNWKDAELKIHPACPIEDKNYDVFYVDEDEFTADTYGDCADRSKTDWFWVVDREYDFNGKLLFTPSSHEQEYIHVFKIPDHLEERYPIDCTDAWDNRCGGVRLVNKDFDMTKHKYQKNITPVRYDIFYSKNISEYDSHARKSRTKMFWLVDEEHEINEVFNFVPHRHDQKTIHIFKIGGQLEHRYPRSITNVSDNRCGGVKLIPKNFKTDSIKYIPQNPTGDKKYPVIFVDNVDQYTEVFQDGWVIDKDYQVNDKIEWTPPIFQRNCIHTFHLGDQLRHKYPESIGGVRWIPVDWNGEIVIHSDIPNAIPEYPIYYEKDPTKNPKKDHNCWVADENYRINETIKWAPGSFDTDKIHVFHIHKQLQNKYTESMGGLYWYPANIEDAEFKIHKDPLYLEPKTYPIYKVKDPSDYKDISEDCWLVDEDYILEDKDFNFIPWQIETEKHQIHNFQVIGQLEHKYPESMGGIYWVPANRNNEINVHEDTPFGEQLSFPVFETEEEGRLKSNSNWFWVVDTNVKILEEFDFSYIPKIWDNGKTHVWQKLNPITKRQYDYSGVKLCPKIPQTKGRPKYIREPACIQKKFPVYTLTANDYLDGLQTVYERLAEQSNNDMFWVVDAFTILEDDFNFDYYPTQWDIDSLHVWQNEDGEHKQVRLVPKSLFMEKQYTDKEIANNSFENLKLINTIASRKPKWPVIHLQSLERNEFINAIKDIETPFVWTVDPDVKVEQDVLDNGFVPVITDVNKIHSWQKLNMRTGKVHGYGGLRLWPTNVDYSDIKSEDLKLNRFKNLQYVKEVGSSSMPYEIFCISYKEDILEVDKNIQRVTSKLIKHGWVNHIRGVKGIFEAHKACAKDCKTDMFWVIDADAEVTDEFMFDYIPDVYDKEVVHVWASKNPVNGLEYGYGGVKLFPTEMVRQATSWGLDFTTGLSSRFKAMPQVSCITKFNTDAFSTWRSAFRECVKLTLNSDEESKQRLDAWLNTGGDADFVEEAKKGALEGNLFAKNNKDNLTELNKINDYTWLEEQWKQ